MSGDVFALVVVAGNEFKWRHLRVAFKGVLRIATPEIGDGLFVNRAAFGEDEEVAPAVRLM